MFKALDQIWANLRDGEYLHILLESVLIVGVFFATVAFIFALTIKDKRVKVFALVMLAISCFAIYPYTHSYNKSVRESKRLAATSDVKARMEHQQSDRRSTQWTYYALGGTALLTLLFAREGKQALVLYSLTIGGGIAVTLLGVWLHIQEQKIFHPNLRGKERKAAQACHPPPPGAFPTRVRYLSSMPAHISRFCSVPTVATKPPRRGNTAPV